MLNLNNGKNNHQELLERVSKNKKTFKNIRFKIIYLLIGIILCIATILSGTYGLSNRNINIYKKAINLQNEMNKVGFQKFYLRDYPVCFNDGNYDYVISKKEEQLKIQKRKPVLPVFVGTAYLVEDHYEVIVPTIEKFSKMFSIFNTASNISAINESKKLNYIENDYGDKEQIATIWHEGFHAYQFTNYYRNIEKILKDVHEDGTIESMVVKAVDANANVVNLYEKEIKVLKKAVLCESIDEVKEYVLEYKKLDDERRMVLSTDILKIEEYYERVEGPARYIESNAYLKQYSEGEYHKRYISSIDIYDNGSSKYYRMGMAKCLLLDKLNAGWKENYDFSTSLTDLIYQQIGGENGISGIGS